MTDIPKTFAEARIIVLFKDELCEAAASLALAIGAAQKLAGTKDHADSVAAMRAAHVAVGCCWNALQHLTNPHADIVLLESASLLKKAALPPPEPSPQTQQKCHPDVVAMVAPPLGDDVPATAEELLELAEAFMRRDREAADDYDDPRLPTARRMARILLDQKGKDKT